MLSGVMAPLLAMSHKGLQHQRWTKEIVLITSPPQRCTLPHFLQPVIEPVNINPRLQAKPGRQSSYNPRLHVQVPYVVP